MASLHPQVQAILDAEARRSPSESVTVEQARADYDAEALAHVGEPEEVASVRDVPHGRLYVPQDAHGAVLWIHGGAFYLGTIAAYDALCRALANASGAAVLAVDYRRAPESPFPGPLEDCDRALAWLAAEFAGQPLAVAGDSAGGNMAAVVARRARDAGGPDLAFQLLVYPMADAACATRSMQDFGGGEFGITVDGMKRAYGLYAPGLAAHSPDVSPLRAVDLAGLPPALVVLAECDPLTDEGSDYADRLRAAGVDARVSVYPGMVHGFFRWLGKVDAGREALAEAGTALRAALK